VKYGGSAAIQKEIRVGIVGANANVSWAKLSHVPAVKGLPGLKLAAVATRNEQSARQAADALGADRWFSDPYAMIRDDRIDVVTIAVNVPAHRDLVLKALDAGKAVYCEAPLGRTVSEVEQMARAIRSRHTAIGLQSRFRWPAVTLTDIAGESYRETPDYVGVLGKTRSGAVFTADISGGVPPQDVRFCFEIRGSEGWLSLTNDHPYGFQAGDLKLTSNVPFVAPEKAALSGGLMGAAINVGEVYAQLVRDVHAGTYKTPGFEHALHNARLIEAVRRAAEQTAVVRWCYGGP
jgi:predicted dehydrogenase